MKLKAGVVLHYLFLDNAYCLMSIKNAKILVEYFKMLDVHNKSSLNGKHLEVFIAKIMHLILIDR